jgi:pimeloyl-ACP methyl ester carboxylesterase
MQKVLEVYAGRKIDVPSLYISGKQDWGIYQDPGAVENMQNGISCSKFKGVELVDGAGHWVQQEQPEKVVELVSKFLKGVKVDAVSY